MLNLKTKCIYLGFLLIFESVLFANEAMFNVYDRNIFSAEPVALSYDSNIGKKIKYEKIDDSDFSYVKGFFYNSDSQKFKDTIKNGKIIKTEYFSQKGEKIFERNYEYDIKNNISSIETRAKYHSEKENYFNKYFFKYENHVVTVEFTLNFTLSKNNKTYTTIEIGSGELNSDFSPKNMETSFFVYTNEECAKHKINEKWTRRKNSCKYFYSLDGETICDYMEKRMDNFFYSEEKILDKVSFSDTKIFNGKTLRREQSFNGKAKKWKMECIITPYYTEVKNDEYTQIFLADEFILLENGSAKSRLDLPLELFEYRYAVNKISF